MSERGGETSGDSHRYSNYVNRRHIKVPAANQRAGLGPIVKTATFTPRNIHKLAHLAHTGPFVIRELMVVVREEVE